jgi:hypothetical protein
MNELQMAENVIKNELRKSAEFETKVVGCNWYDQHEKEFIENGWEIMGYSEFGRDGIPSKIELRRIKHYVIDSDTVQCRCGKKYSIKNSHCMECQRSNLYYIFPSFGE